MTLVDPVPSAPPAAAGSIPAQRKTDRPAGRSTGKSRDRYIDCLRAAALVRVVIYHLFGWMWLPVLFPSMGIMFALAGSLVAASLDRSPGRHWRVLAKRTRRLLPPLWLMGLIVVPVMIWHGWTYTDTAGSPLRWRTLLLWIFPISDPPGSAWGDDFVVPLWYIRAYLWFLLLSPAFLWMFRRWPKRVLAVPLGTLAVGSVGIVTLSGRSGDVILTMGIFGACWMLGFAHHDKTLRGVPIRKIVPLGLALLGAGLAWALTHQDPQTHWDIDNIPVADALYGLGAVLLLLRFYPDFSWVARRPMLDKLVAVVNSRAMTIYLWNNIAIFLTAVVAGAWSVTAALDNGGVTGRIQQFVLTWLLIAVAIVVFGWVEDLAAARPIRINPWPRTRQAGTGQSRSRPARPRPARTRPALPARALRPAPLLIGTAAVVATAVGISLGTLQGTGTPGRTGLTDTVPNTPAHPQALQPRPANLAQPNIRPPVRSGQQNPTGGAGPAAATKPTTTTSPQPRPPVGPSPTSARSQADSRAPAGPVSKPSPQPVAAIAPHAQPTAPASPTRAGPVPAPGPVLAPPATPPASAAPASSAAPTATSPAAPISSAAPSPAGSAAPISPAAPISSAALGTAAGGPVYAPSSSPAAPPRPLASRAA